MGRRVYQHRDGTSQRRRRCILLLRLVGPSARARTRLAYKTCLRTPQREDAAPKSPETRRQFTRPEPSPEGVWGLCDVAPGVRRRTNANGCAAPTRRRGGTGKPNPVRQSARLAETAIARETVARRRRAGPGSLSLSVCVSLLSVDRRHGARSSSSKRSARVLLLAHHSGRRAAAAAAALCKESQLPAFPAASRRPRAIGPKGPWRRPGAAGRPSRTLRRGCLFGEGAAGPQPMQPRAMTSLARTVRDTPGNRF